MITSLYVRIATYICSYVHILATYSYKVLNTYVCNTFNIASYLIYDVGTSSELHKPTKDTINPAYHTITGDHCKKPVEEPVSYYEEVKKPSEVKMTQNPAYAVP